jgi:hypothetical protein
MHHRQNRTWSCFDYLTNETEESFEVGNDNFLRFIEDKSKCKQVVSKATINYESLLDMLFVKVNSDVNIETDVVEAYWSDHKLCIQL